MFCLQETAHQAALRENAALRDSLQNAHLEPERALREAAGATAAAGRSAAENATLRRVMEDSVALKVARSTPLLGPLGKLLRKNSDAPGNNG